MHTAFLGLGTNLGDREQNLLQAFELIGRRVGKIKRKSRLYRSEPWGFKSDNDFLNAAVMVETALAPHELLCVTQEIERAMGRTHKTTNGEYRDRIMDIDILLYDDLTIDSAELTLPHPRINERPFVREPLNEILDL